jgi:ribonuclease D
MYETSKNPGVEGDTDDQKLAGLLTIYRTNTYRENKVKAYNVFTNDELKNLVKYKPTTKDDLKKYQVFISEEAKKAVSVYSEERTHKEFIDYLTKVFEARKLELESIIRTVENEENNEAKAKK